MSSREASGSRQNKHANTSSNGPKQDADIQEKLKAMLTQVQRGESAPRVVGQQPITKLSPSNNGASRNQNRQQNNSQGNRSRFHSQGANSKGMGGGRQSFGLLGAQPDHVKGRKTLVLDLDETLVHSQFKAVKNPDYIIPVDIEGQVSNIYVMKRPGAEYFLQQMSNFFELVIYTASLSKYADPLMNMMDPKGYCTKRLFREHCSFVNGVFVKDMSVIGRDMKDAIIIDNSPTSYMLQPECGLPIVSWFDDMQDRILYDYMPFLTEMSKMYDMREAITSFVRNNQVSVPFALQTCQLIRAREVREQKDLADQKTQQIQQQQQQIQQSKRGVQEKEHFNDQQVKQMQKRQKEEREERAKQAARLQAQQQVVQKQIKMVQNAENNNQFGGQNGANSVVQQPHQLKQFQKGRKEPLKAQHNMVQGQSSLNNQQETQQSNQDDQKIMINGWVDRTGKTQNSQIKVRQNMERSAGNGGQIRNQLARAESQKEQKRLGKPARISKSTLNQSNLVISTASSPTAFGASLGGVTNKNRLTTDLNSKIDMSLISSKNHTRNRSQAFNTHNGNGAQQSQVGTHNLHHPRNQTDLNGSMVQGQIPSNVAGTGTGRQGPNQTPTGRNDSSKVTNITNIIYNFNLSAGVQSPNAAQPASLSVANPQNQSQITNQKDRQRKDEAHRVAASKEQVAPQISSSIRVSSRSQSSLAYETHHINPANSKIQTNTVNSKLEAPQIQTQFKRPKTGGGLVGGSHPGTRRNQHTRPNHHPPNSNIGHSVAILANSGDVVDQNQRTGNHSQNQRQLRNAAISDNQIRNDGTMVRNNTLDPSPPQPQIATDSQNQNSGPQNKPISLEKQRIRAALKKQDFEQNSGMPGNEAIEQQIGGATNQTTKIQNKVIQLSSQNTRRILKQKIQVIKNPFQTSKSPKVLPLNGLQNKILSQNRSPSENLNVYGRQGARISKNYSQQGQVMTPTHTTNGGGAAQFRYTDQLNQGVFNFEFANQKLLSDNHRQQVNNSMNHARLAAVQRESPVAADRPQAAHLRSYSQNQTSRGGLNKSAIVQTQLKQGSGVNGGNPSLITNQTSPTAANSGQQLYHSHQLHQQNSKKLQIVANNRDGQRSVQNQNKNQMVIQIGGPSSPTNTHDNTLQSQIMMQQQMKMGGMPQSVTHQLGMDQESSSRRNHSALVGQFNSFINKPTTTKNSQQMYPTTQQSALNQQQHIRSSFKHQQPQQVQSQSIGSPHHHNLANHNQSGKSQLTGSLTKSFNAFQTEVSQSNKQGVVSGGMSKQKFLTQIGNSSNTISRTATNSSATAQQYHKGSQKAQTQLENPIQTSSLPQNNSFFQQTIGSPVSRNPQNLLQQNSLERKGSPDLKSVPSLSKGGPTNKNKSLIADHSLTQGLQPHGNILSKTSSPKQIAQHTGHGGAKLRVSSRQNNSNSFSKNVLATTNSSGVNNNTNPHHQHLGISLQSPNSASLHQSHYNFVNQPHNHPHHQPTMTTPSAVIQQHRPANFVSQLGIDSSGHQTADGPLNLQGMYPQPTQSPMSFKQMQQAKRQQKTKQNMTTSTSANPADTINISTLGQSRKTQQSHMQSLNGSAHLHSQQLNQQKMRSQSRQQKAQGQSTPNRQSQTNKQQGSALAQFYLSQNV